MQLFAKNLRIIISLICLMTLITARADASLDFLEFTLNSDGQSYSVGQNSNARIEGAIAIPAEFNDLPVTAIKYRAFAGCSNLASVKIPNSVTSIGSYAFSGCSSLTSIQLPNSVKTIGDEGTFSDCSSLTSIQLSNSLASIVPYSFSGCSSLTSVEIPNSATSIGNSAFQNCTGLTSVFIPNSVKTIGGDAFRDCTSLTSIELPNSVTEIWSSAFTGCSSLKTIEIPNSVTTIGAFAFTGCSQLYSIKIANSVTSIGAYAFKDCTNLNSVNVPNSVTTIEKSLFQNCSNLTTIELPNSIKSIQASAFKNCSKLVEVKLPNSLVSIKESAFSGCSSLTSIEIPNSVTSIDECVFMGCYGLVSIKLSNSVTSINTRTFSGCSRLTSIDIPNSVTSIGDNAFWGCYGLVSIKLSNSVTSIGKGAFYSCSGLTSIEIPNSVKIIMEDAFWGCSKLETIKSLCTIDTYRQNLSLPETVSIYVIRDQLEDYKTSEILKGYQILPLSQVSISKNIPEGGLVEGDSYLIPHKEEAHLIATPADEYNFVGWYIDDELQSDNKEYHYIANDEDVTIEARFKSNKPLITIKAKSTHRYYGDDNPIFEYEVSGGELNEKPEIVCDASITSDVGEYEIVVSKGNISYPNIQFENGKLLINPAPLSISVGEYVRAYGEKNPEIVLTHSGFKNDETKDVLTTQPVVNIDAGQDSPVGEYTITPSGAEAQNYDISYVPGKLTIVKANQSIEWDVEQTEFNPGEDLVLDASATSSLPVKYDVSDPSVAKVEGNSLIFLSVGSVTVTAKQEGNENYNAADDVVKNFTVSSVPVESIALDVESLSIKVDDEHQFIATILPDNATLKAVTWSSSNPDVATISENGLLKGIKEGKTTITATANDGSDANGSCEVTVTDVSSGINGIETSGNAYYIIQNGVLKLFNIPDKTAVRIIALDGKTIYNGCDSEIKLSPGIYILMIGNKTYKIKM